MSEGYTGLGLSLEVEILFAAGVIAAICAGYRMLNSPSKPNYKRWIEARREYEFTF